MSRWTLNLGVRYDSFLGTVPEQQTPAGTYVPARNFAEVRDAPDWKDVTPRLGAAYDIFGNGKTAIKTALGKYLDWETASSAVGPHNPILRMVPSATRTWTDRNGDYVPQESELGPLSNANFGNTVPGTTFADDVRVGWGVRDYSWQSSVAIQQELRPGMAVNIGYFRTWYGNFTVTQNRAVTPADYSPFCVTAPTDSRLGSASGQQICGLYDVSPARFGRVDNYITFASNFGEQYQNFNGVDMAMNVRFGAGGLLQGGYSVGQTVTDNCAVITDTPQKQFCRQSPPWSAGTQVKLSVWCTARLGVPDQRHVPSICRAFPSRRRMSCEAPKPHHHSGASSLPARIRPRSSTSSLPLISTKTG